MKNFKPILLLILLISSLSPLLIYTFTPDQKLEFTNSIKIGTFNLHYGITGDGTYSLSGLQDVLKAEIPDMIGFEEVTYGSPFNGYVNMYQDMSMMMSSYGYNSQYISQGSYYSLANAFFTRFDVESDHTYIYDNQNIFTRNILDVRVKINSVVVQVLTTHFTHIPEGGASGELRVKQASELLIYATKTKPEVDYQIVVGDFNVKDIYKINYTAEYRLLNSTFHDAWQWSGNTNSGYTSTAKNPEKRIDYIFVGPTVSVSECHTYQTTQSDHLPVFCTIVLS